MKKKFVTSLALAVIGTAVVVGIPQDAHALLQLEMSIDNLNWTTITDEGAGDSSSGFGQLVWSGSMGNWNIIINTGISKNIIGSADNPKLDLNSVEVSSLVAGGNLWINLTDTFYGPMDPSLAGFRFDIGGTAGNTVSAKAYYDPANAPFGMPMANLIYDAGTMGPGAFSNIGQSPGTAPYPFSLTIATLINHNAANQISSFDALITPVPEPATMLLFGTGLVGLAGAARRRLSKKV